VDVNANPLRDAIADIHAAMLNKSWHLDNRPGLGLEELPRELQRYQTLSLTQCAKMVSPPSTSRTLATG
jgi:hypothetical protein